MQAQSMNSAYYDTLLTTLTQGVVEVNSRTAVKTQLIEGGTSFKLKPARVLPVPGNRRYYPHIAAAEVAWQVLGTKDPDFIMGHAPKLWSKFIEEGELKTAYGWRWQAAFGRNQLALAVKELEENPTSRQIWVQAWDPRSDGLGGPQPKNIPCPIGFSLSRHRDTVHMSLYIRSSDLFVGLPYDVMGYSLMLAAIAATVGCKPGTLHVTLAHAHLYEPHWEMAKKSVASGDVAVNWVSCRPALPTWTLDQILAAPDNYVRHVRELSKGADHSNWQPMPEVIE